VQHRPPLLIGTDLEAEAARLLDRRVWHGRLGLQETTGHCTGRLIPAAHGKLFSLRSQAFCLRHGDRPSLEVIIGMPAELVPAFMEGTFC
jgi:hypothetical protein